MWPLVVTTAIDKPVRLATDGKRWAIRCVTARVAFHAQIYAQNYNKSECSHPDFCSLIC